MGLVSNYNPYCVSYIRFFIQSPSEIWIYVSCCIKIGTAEAENLYAALAIKKRSVCYSFCYQ